jgi:hypothetical protein
MFGDFYSGEIFSPKLGKGKRKKEKGAGNTRYGTELF